MEPAYPRTTDGKFDWGGLTLFLASIGAVALCVWIALPFLPALTGAVVLAVVTQRPYRWILARLHNATLAATASLTVVGLSIVIPALFFAQNAARHLLNVVRSIQSGVAEQGIRQFIAQHPRVSAMLQYASDNLDINQATEKTAGAVTGHVAVILGGSVAALMQTVVMLFILFFLYRDGRAGLAALRSMLPLDEDETGYLLQRIGTAIDALVLGRFAVAGMQGLVAGIAYACVGVGGALLLGVTTTLFALVPAVGAFVVWLPIVIYLAAVHHWIQAIVLLAVGALIVSTLDNFLYPVLVGPRLRLHTVPIFLSMLGGVAFFGVAGLIVGPITFVVTESLILIFRHRATGEALPSGARAD